MIRLIIKILIISTIFISNNILAYDKNELIGMWVAIGHSKILTTDKADLTLNSEKGEFRWEIKGNGKIRMYGDIGSEEFPYKLEGNMLTVNQWGMEQEFEIVEISDSTLEGVRYSVSMLRSSMLCVA